MQDVRCKIHDEQFAISRAFTLLELLVVISILVILASIAVVGFSGVLTESKEAATKALISRIESALRRYKEVFMAYPPSESGQGEGSQNLYYFLGRSFEVASDFDPITGQCRMTRFGPAMANGFNKKEVNEEEYVIDIWKTPLYYKNPGEDHSPDSKNNEAFVDIESYGVNQADDSDGSSDDDDINNWKIPSAPQ